MKVEAHDPKTAIGLDKEAVRPPGSDLTNPAGRNFHRRQPVDFRAVSEFTVTVEARPPEAAVNPAIETVVCSCGKFPDVIECPQQRVLKQFRQKLVGARRPIAQCAIVILAHAPKTRRPERKLAGDRSEKGVFGSGGNGRHAAGLDLLWRMRTVGRAVTQLAFIIRSHRQQAAVGSQEKTMVIANSDSRDIASDKLLRKIGPAEAKPQSELSVGIPTHPPEAAVGQDKKRVLAPGGNLRHRRRSMGGRRNDECQTRQQCDGSSKQDHFHGFGIQ